MKSADFLDAVRKKHGLTSDNKLAHYLGIDRTRISGYRTGRREFDEDACEMIAEELGESPEYVMASIQAARTKNPKHAGRWQALANLAKKSQAAALALLITGLLSASPNGVSQAKGLSDAVAVNDLYIIRICVLALAEKASRFARRIAQIFGTTTAPLPASVMP